jgi:hypothetical protein
LRVGVKEQGYNLIISGGDVVSDISSEAGCFFCVTTQGWGTHKFNWLDHSWAQVTTPNLKEKQWIMLRANKKMG